MNWHGDETSGMLMKPLEKGQIIHGMRITAVGRNNLNKCATSSRN